MRPLGRVGAVAILALAASANSARAGLILLSDLRTLTAWSTLAAGQTVSANPFAAFDGTASTYGSSGRMVSTLSSTELNASMRSAQFLDLTRAPYGTIVSTHVDALFQVSFAVIEPTLVSLTGYRDNETVGGLIATSLTSSAGSINLNWGGSMYNNYLAQSILLAPDTYTLTGQISMTYTLQAPIYDGGTMRLDLNMSTVPDAGTSAGLLGLGLALLWLIKWQTEPVRRAYRIR